MAGGEEHLLAGEHELDGLADMTRGKRRQRHMRPCPQARAEGAADEGTDDLDVLGGQAEDRSDLGLLIHEKLALAPQRQPIAVPGSDRRVRLHRIVVFTGDVIDFVDLDGRLRHGGIGIAPRSVRARLPGTILATCGSA